MKVSPIPLSLAALALAAAGSLSAWQVQAAAERHLSEAHRVQRADPGPADTEAPRVEEYEQILATLERSITIRREIDGRLREVEAMAAALQDGRQEAEEISRRARQELRLIAAALGSALDEAELSARSLDALGSGLSTSARLAHLIAEELDKLDRSMGPSVAGRR